MRKFVPITGCYPKLPVRKTQHSAGYDICALRDGVVPAGKTAMVPTGLKVYMNAGEYLAIHIRSSVGIAGISLMNGTGIIDGDYADNPENEGHIHLPLRNNTDKPFIFYEGDRLAQGIFSSYKMTDDDRAHEKRTGGMGSTGIQ